MHKNPVLWGLLAIIFASFSFYAISSLYHLNTYYSLTSLAKAESLQWFVEEIGSEDFRVGATYAFTVDGEKKTGETIFSDRKFRNPSSADDAMKIKAKNAFDVYYDSKNPSHSSLENPFPTKDSLYAVSLFLLFLYFFGLGIYNKISN